MTWRFSETSLARLQTCHQELQTLAHAVICERDCTVICGHRGKCAQEVAVLLGNSKVHWPNSKHNKDPSEAIDLGPWPLDWDNIDEIVEFGRLVLDVAERLRASGDMTFEIRWGGDWDRDGEVTDERFFDGVHFEIMRPEVSSE